MTSPSSGLDMGESSSSLITKRKIQEMVAQIDPSERLEPEVEDVSKIQDLGPDADAVVTQPNQVLQAWRHNKGGRGMPGQRDSHSCSICILSLYTHFITLYVDSTGIGR